MKVILEITAEFNSLQTPLQNELIDLKDEIENFTLFSNVNIKVKRAIP